MAVYARGYRPYKGPLRAAPAAFVIAGEAYRTAVRSTAFKRIRTLFLIWFVMIAFFLYLQVGSELSVFVRGGLKTMLAEEEIPGFILMSALNVFYAGVAVLVALLAILVGAGLVSNDLASRALPLYLVRPVRPIDYVIGKTLVIPLVLVWMALLPGVGFYLLMGFWQDPGETFPFLAREAGVLVAILQQYFIATASYTGIVLFLSSRSPRRNAVAVASAAIILGGYLLRIVSYGLRVEGALGDAMRIAGIPANTVTPFLLEVWPKRWPRGMRFLPSMEAIFLLSAALLLIGFIAAWRRAQSVEVAG